MTASFAPEAPFGDLLLVAIIIPVAMLLLFRVWPVLRGNEPVGWVYAMPFVTFFIGLLGTAFGAFVLPYVWFELPIGATIITAVIVVELLVVVVTIHLLPDAEVNAISLWAVRTSARLRRRQPPPPNSCPFCGREMDEH